MAEPISAAIAKIFNIRTMSVSSRMSLRKLRKAHEALIKAARGGLRPLAMPELGRTRTGIGVYLARRRRDWLPASESKGWLRRRTLMGKPPGDGPAAPGTLGEKLLDDAILERMKRHHRKPASLFQDSFGRRERMDKFAKFIINGNAERLECACRGMYLSSFAGHHAGDHSGKRSRRGEGRFRAVYDNRTRNPARRPFLAKIIK